ncbi:MAG: TAT-variant-translocated molybdopterin oxidoreductase [Rubricoccaceae bacterium]|nr:TAT-variant-translocated molybdopterin oxidoreductase [Rubricoccaceae bacterium]
MIDLDVLSPADVAADGQPKIWRSREDLGDSADYAALRNDEFLPGATDVKDVGPSRRSFLKIMGASMAMAGLAGCRRPTEEILPYARKPEEIVPGLPNFYATAMPRGGSVEALLVQSYEGRPTKIEGNPEHPVSRGKSGVFAQASILNLYDPDRSRNVFHDGSPSTWNDFAAAVRGLNVSGDRVVVLAEPTSSTTEQVARQAFMERFVGARWIDLHPQGDDVAALGAQMAFGSPYRPIYRFSEADVIVSFDADFLGSEDPNGVANSREFAAGRNVDVRGSMSRFYAFESTYTTTGGMADHRQAMRRNNIVHFAVAVGQALGAGTASAGSSAFSGNEVLRHLVDDARASGGNAVFVSGQTMPPEIHALCAALNAQYGTNVVQYLDTGADPVQTVSETLPAVIADMQAGNVDLVVMLGTNPVYSLPADLNFAEALANVDVSIHLGLHRDETGQLASWHVPETHYLEAWGDGRAWDGTHSIIQPLIAPLYDPAHSSLEITNFLATGSEIGGYQLVRDALLGQLGSENVWRTALHDGFVPNTAYPTASAGASQPDVSALPAVSSEDVELVFRPSPTVGDGTFSNNAWMQELPHPVSKIVWDNVAVLSRHTAETLGVGVNLSEGKHYADTVTLAVNGSETTLPVWIQEGHPDGSITVSLGYGREIATEREIRDRSLLATIFNRDTDIYRPGPVGNGVGSNVAPLRSLESMASAPSVTVTPTGETVMLASTQDHGTMAGREIVRMATAAEYQRNPDVIQEGIHTLDNTPWESYPSLWTEPNAASDDPRISEAMYSSEQWAMTIDLNTCSGCNACVVACQSENNIQVVGKDQVSRGRELHWLRLDRYYTGDESNPGMVVQPMMCQHCENAPCEQVCPVAATSHSPDGINEMTYNRCIGTRYCSNNCPYKVRRFNFLNWTKHLPIQVQMAHNPNVTVRFRGVMEKCTYCVQRVRRAQQYAHIEDRPIRDGEVVTACQQACPSDAIVFGNIADPESAVSRSKQNPRSYEVLAELAVRPRTSYLARLSNPNPGLVEAAPAAEGGH